MDKVTVILDSCVRGYHVYKYMWNATPGETLTCIRERKKKETMCWQCLAVQSDGNIVGHITYSRQISCICMLFIRRGGVLNCLITGSTWYSRNLPQGGHHIKKFALVVHEMFAIICLRCQYIIHEIRENFVPRKFPPIRYKSKKCHPQARTLSEGLRDISLPLG